MENWDHWVRRVIKAVKASLGDPRFGAQLYLLLENDRPQRSELHEVLTRPYLRLSWQMDLTGIQEGATARNRVRACELAQLLIDDAGNLAEETLAEALGILAEHSHSLGLQRHHDSPRNVHLYRALMWLQQDSRLRRQLLQIDIPWKNGHAQSLIRDALHLPPNLALDVAMTRRAALSAWLTYLRQNVGSCFATAPAILIQTEQPWQFLRDLEEMLSIGQISRTFGGVRYAVPLCKSWGMGDLLRPFAVPALPLLAGSPGLQAAFGAAGLLSPVASEQHRLLQIESLLTEVARSMAQPITNAEAVIRAVLQREFDVTDADIEEVHRRISAPQLAPPSSGKAGKVATFERKFALARTAFRNITENPLLKTWEFTVASFADVKADFSRWNLYACLGLQPGTPGGIGDAIHHFLQERLDRLNRELDDLNGRYEAAYASLSIVESRMRQASEDQLHWLRIEHSQKVGDVNGIHAERQIISAKGRKLGGMLRDLVELYGRLFPDYFQEVYDPDMHDVSIHPFDDSPAGFRLLYKHGRANPAVWTLIYTPDEFIQSLTDFFVATEGLLQADLEFPELKEEVSALVTAIIAHVRTQEFLESTFDRAAERHQAAPTADPLEHLEKIGKKPWAYVSGGTMTTLVSAYFGRDDLPTLAQRSIESPIDLLIFFVDTLKGLPPTETQSFLDDPMASMLIQSPTHGFLLKPGLSPFRQAWLDRGNTSTWIRRHLIRPGQGFLESLVLTTPMMRRVQKELNRGLPQEITASVDAAFRRLKMQSGGVREFRREVLEGLGRFSQRQELSANSLADRLDGLLLGMLPFVQPKEFRSTVLKLLKELFIDDAIFQQRATVALDLSLDRDGPQDPISAQELQDVLQSLCMLVTGGTTCGEDLAWKIRALMRRHGHALPGPMLVADTNWSREFFAFLVNPGSGELDFWRVDYLGLTGSPMSEWRRWFDGSQTTPWGLYTRTHEYTAPHSH